MDVWLNPLIGCTCGVQLAALWLRLKRRTQAALWTASVNVAIALTLTVIALQGSGSPQQWDAFIEGIVALQCASVIAVATGLIVRRWAGLLFWPAWLGTFHLVYVLVYVRFFFRIAF
jgi:hypothetical protein